MTWYIEPTTRRTSKEKYDILDKNDDGVTYNVADYVSPHYARLIAAAPDLLEALEMATAEATELLPQRHPLSGKTIKKMQSAIAKTKTLRAR